MEHVVGFVIGLMRTLAVATVFYVIGLLVLKVITLGRYPRIAHLKESQRQGFTEYDLVALPGFLSPSFCSSLFQR